MSENENPRRLPLWRTTVEEMLTDGIEYGQTFGADFFEAKLRSSRDTAAFSFGLSRIRRLLLDSGFYLDGRGQAGQAFTIIPAGKNKEQGAAYQSIAMHNLKRGLSLCINTRVDQLTAEERRLHEAFTERLANKFLVASRSEQIAKIVEKTKPKLLK